MRQTTKHGVFAGFPEVGLREYLDSPQEQDLIYKRALVVVTDEDLENAWGLILLASNQCHARLVFDISFSNFVSAMNISEDLDNVFMRVNCNNVSGAQIDELVVMAKSLELGDMVLIPESLSPTTQEMLIKLFGSLEVSGDIVVEPNTETNEYFAMLYGCRIASLRG